MSDKPTENPVEDKPQENPVDPKPETPTIEDLTAKIEALTKSNETQKTEIAGLNKSYANKNNEYLELVKKNETDAERKNREADEKATAEQERIDKLTTRESDLIKKENAYAIKEKAIELELNVADVVDLGFTTIEQVEKYKAKLAANSEAVKGDTTKNIETDLGSLNRPNYNNEGNTSPGFPDAISRALKR